jgi:hypothetical protein
MAARVTVKSRQDDVSSRTATEHDVLLAATLTLERALGRPARGREVPRAESVTGTLRGLAVVLIQHRYSAEAEVGLLAELLRQMPETAFQIGRLRDEHRALLDETEGLLDDLENISAARTVTVDAPRRRAAHLLSALRAHQTEQADLIFESFDRDIGESD